MTILREYGIESKIDRYNLSKAPGKNLSDFAGQRINVKAYLLVEDTDVSTGEIKKALKVICQDDDEIIGTRSQSFIAGFEDFLTFMETNQIDSFIAEPVRSKAGRTYLSFKA